MVPCEFLQLQEFILVQSSPKTSRRETMAAINKANVNKLQLRNAMVGPENQQQRIKYKIAAGKMYAQVCPTP